MAMLLINDYVFFTMIKPDQQKKKLLTCQSAGITKKTFFAVISGYGNRPRVMNPES
jgi:hypothetical protein